MKKVKEKKEENYIKKGRDLKNASFWAINSKHFALKRIFISVRTLLHLCTLGENLS